MKKNFLFYIFILALFSVDSNIFFCCCDCNSLLYNTSKFSTYKKKLKEGNLEFIYEENAKFEGQIFLNKKEYEVKKIDLKNSVGLYTVEDKWDGLNVYCLKINNEIPCHFFRDTRISNDSNTNLVIFFHGNGEFAFGDQKPLLDKIVFEAKYDLLIPELPGYPGNNQYDFSEETRLEYMESLFNFCKTYYKDQRIIILGHSLGCYFATYLASMDEENAVFNKLIIACPFLTDKTAAKYIGKTNTSCCCVCCGECLSECIVTPIYREKLLNEENIKNVKSDIDILYAPNDKVISPKDAESLFNIFKNSKDYNIGEDQDVLEKNGSSQKIRLRPIIPKKFTNEEKQNLDEAILKAVNLEMKEKKVENINELNSFFLGEERKVFNRNVGHSDVLLYDQIKYYILN